MSNIIPFDLTKVTYDSFDSALKAAENQHNQFEGMQLLVVPDNKGKYHLVPLKANISFTVLGNNEPKD